ncbi:hypothetical protein [Ferroacidibacillus organovorans]|uniref:Cell division protein FtsL n=1 Tax=Ferroacidibacillus organovorans TaxID=1765683 RepID=A0A853KAZ6_9BACL|nr:hypothetical protein [Ferroacidibacillus organovorans]KYP81855.1 hypothetical protein AYJ22_05715 [Ferroacidibacillus organovorans]OAG94196.1 hypothetical protein AYW79_06720 [Ferroacidibacillus organovorans]
MAIEPLSNHSAYAPIPRSKAIEQPLQPKRPDLHAKREVKDRLGLIGSLLLCALVGVFLVSRYATLVTQSEDINQIKQTLTQQNALDASLQGQVLQLSSPERILTIAEKSLHMKAATPVVIGAAHP